LEHFVEMDVGQSPWPFEDGRFSLIRADCLLPHLPPSSGKDPDPVDVFAREAFRTLAPGGRLIVTAPDPRDVPPALGKIHLYRLVHPEMFRGYLHKGPQGVKRAQGGPFSSISVEWGHVGAKELRRRNEGRPHCVSRLLPGFMPVGDSKLGVFTHLFRRMRPTWLMRGEKIKIVLTK
jgi:SAM-dependent methyltransferase